MSVPMRRVVQVILADNVDLTALCLKNLFQLEICVNNQDYIFMTKVTIKMAKAEWENYDYDYDHLTDYDYDYDHLTEVSINRYLET